jgi:glycosyltransferase involved in cell wall biosynthesis
MRVAVYNRFWSTGGGGERYGGAIAAALAAQHDVELLSGEAVDVDWLRERLDLDLHGVTVRTVPDEPRAVEQTSTGYELLVNVSHESADRNGARHGVYVVHFPSAPMQAEWQWRRRAVRISYGEGFYPPEPGATWTDGDATLLVTAPPGASIPIDLVFAHWRPPEIAETTVRISVDDDDGKEIEWLLVPGARVRRRSGSTARVVARGRGDGAPVAVHIRSDTFCPDQVVGSGDTRLLGVALASVSIGASVPWLPRPAGGLPTLSAPSCLNSYDAIVTNSAFTQGWVTRKWGVESHVLRPAARRVPPAAAKEPIIVAIGRFFPPERGHCKRQLEMVTAFRRLAAKGWALHLVGGCKSGETGYLDQVRRAASGLPVEFHIDAPGHELEALLARARIFWHATGLGEDVHGNPERFEHFGIATAEAMSAGAVPVVLGQAGPLEVVRDGVDGFHFQTIDGLVTRTGTLIADDALRQTMSAAAVERATEFSDERFAERARVLFDRFVTEPSATTRE